MNDAILNVPFTFSRNCRSGYVGKWLERCECSRCRRERGEEVNEASEALAEKQAGEVDTKQREWMREFLRK